MGCLAVIHQPDFLPHLGFFHRLLRADVFVLLDHVQFVRHTSRSWTHRDKIKTPRGAEWLSLPTEKCPMATRIKDVKLSRNVDWKDRHLNIIHENYRRARYYDEVVPHIQKLYLSDVDKLVDFNLLSIKMILELLDLRVDMLFASDLDPSGTKNELLVNLLTKVGASKYLSGVGARDYFDPEPFERASIDVVWQNFNHPVYPQLFGDFIPNLSSIDLIFNCGSESSRDILRNSL